MCFLSNIFNEMYVEIALNLAICQICIKRVQCFRQAILHHSFFILSFSLKMHDLNVWPLITCLLNVHAKQSVMFLYVYVIVSIDSENAICINDRFYCDVKITICSLVMNVS